MLKASYQTQINDHETCGRLEQIKGNFINLDEDSKGFNVSVDTKPLRILKGIQKIELRIGFKPALDFLANFSCEKKLKLLFPDFATTLDGLYKCPLVMLTSSVIFSPGLKVTNILESSLLKLSGPLLEGTD